MNSSSNCNFLRLLQLLQSTSNAERIAKVWFQEEIFDLNNAISETGRGGRAVQSVCQIQVNTHSKTQVQIPLGVTLSQSEMTYCLLRFVSCFNSRSLKKIYFNNYNILNNTLSFVSNLNIIFSSSKLFSQLIRLFWSFHDYMGNNKEKTNNTLVPHLARAHAHLLKYCHSVTLKFVGFYSLTIAGNPALQV